MKQYLQLLQDILDNGEWSDNRTGIRTKSIFGYQMRFNLQEGFPAVTTKKLAWKAVVGELLWFLEGSSDERRLAELTYGKTRSELKDKTTIWTANADNQAKNLGYQNDEFIKELGPIYGVQWRNFGDNSNLLNSEKFGFDQIKWLIKEIKTNPNSRRLILSAWNPTKISQMALPPCHVMSIFRVYNGKLNCMLTQRSADTFLGIPFNITSYSLLTHIIARECKLEVGEFVHSIADAHIYENHIGQVKDQLNRKPLELPKLVINENFKLDDRLMSGKFMLNDVDNFKLENYNHLGTIKADMAV